MKSTQLTAEELEQARKRTAELLATFDSQGAETTSDSSRMQALVSELKTHHAELAAQNDALQVARAELLRIRNRYENHYEFAPVGYLTTNAYGQITSANLRAALLLELDRTSLVKTRLTRFMRSADCETFLSTLADVLSDRKDLAPAPECDVKMINSRGETLHVRLEISTNHESDERKRGSR